MSTPEPSCATLPLSRIVKGDNPRRYFDRKKHDDLVASIRIRGILQPILVRPAPSSDDSYAIVAGERRYRAALEAFGSDGEVPAIIREMTDQEALEAAIDENDNRDDASETEQADAAVRVLAACRNDRAEAARRLGWSRAKLDRRLALAELSEAVKLALDERRIKVGHAELLAAIPADKQDKALETILGSGLDVSKTRDLLMRVTQNLGAACFDKTDCTTCPFNSAAQRSRRAALPTSRLTRFSNLTQGPNAMLISSLLPMLARYSLGFDLVAGANDTVTLTILPRKAEGAKDNLEASETRPISITATAAEIDAELARGPDGALGQLIASRRTLADQIAEQRQAAEAARAAAAEAAKAKAAAPKTPAPAASPKTPAPSSPPVDAKAEEPASLW